MIEADGVFNFRDLAAASPSLRAGAVFRSDGIHRTDPAGADRIAATGVRQVLDLRSLGEQEREGMFEHPDVATVACPLVAQSDEVGRQIMAATTDPLHEHNVAMLMGGRDELARTLALIGESIDNERPVLFHCTAGKDRTGLIAALVLGIAGVEDDAIVADYTASADGVLQMRSWYERAGYSQSDKAAEMGIDEERMRHLMRAEAPTMRATLATIRDEFGSFDGLATRIGVDPSAAAAIRGLSG